MKQRQEFIYFFSFSPNHSSIHQFWREPLLCVLSVIWITIMQCFTSFRPRLLPESSLLPSVPYWLWPALFMLWQCLNLNSVFSLLLGVFSYCCVGHLRKHTWYTYIIQNFRRVGDHEANLNKYRLKHQSSAMWPIFLEFFLDGTVSF